MRRCTIENTCRSDSQRGMALVLVLWIVAALAIFASSLGRVVRSEASVIAVTRQMAEGRALGEAAIYQVLQRIALKPMEFRDSAVLQVPTPKGIIDVAVVPWSGLVNINDAPPALLALLLSKAAGLGGGAAEALAQAIVQARNGVDNRQPLRPAWDAPEDLLQVQGMSYGIFASIRGFVVADADGRGSVNPGAAPEALKPWLEGGVGSQQGVSGSRYTLIAKVPFDGTGEALITRQVDVPGGMGPGRLPWTVLAASQTWKGRL